MRIKRRRRWDYRRYRPRSTSTWRRESCLRKRLRIVDVARWLRTKESARHEKSKTESASRLPRTESVGPGTRTGTRFCPRTLDWLHRDSEVPLRGNGVNGREISLGASSHRRRASNTKTAADIYQMYCIRGIKRANGETKRDTKRRRDMFWISINILSEM